MTSDRALSQRIKSLALAVGFDLAGVAKAGPTRETEYLREWIGRGYAGEMDYLARRLEARVDPRVAFAGARSVVAVALRYAPAAAPRASGGAGSPARAAISRYAGGDDYHDVLRDRLRALEWGIEALLGRPVRTRSYVDTGPVQERVFAAHGGLGWLGKNTCLIHPELGSYLFLGVLLTDLELEPDAPGVDQCGSCRACLDACPTDAFVEPYVLDATRCIAYTTIETRGSIPEPLRAAHGTRVFGCDVCQEVCPWNKRRGSRPLADPLGLRERLEVRPEWLRATLEWILNLDEASWRSATTNTALRRARYRGLLRNALVAAGNSGDASLRAALERHARGGDAMLAEHARWALARLGAEAASAPL